MNTEINTTAIFIAHTMAITLMALMFSRNRWALKNQGREGRIIKSMLVITVISCLVDALVFQMDGRTGFLAHMIIYWGNFWQYLGNLLISIQWVVLFVIHIEGKVKKEQRILLTACFLAGVTALIINLFVPIIYSVSADNIYSRNLFYYNFGVIDLILISYSCVYYGMIKVKGGRLKFFPVVEFVVPIVMGILIQNTFYGVSTIWPFIAVAICGVISSLQSEEVFHDNLTGVFNRAYLEAVVKKLERQKKKHIIAMMLDMDDFKQINDTYGHAAGDQALIDVSQIFTEVIGDRGSVIRFAGDEFIILINSSNLTESEKYADKIKLAISEFNKTGQRDYQLSVSIGYSFVNFDNYTLDQFLEEIDQKMYEEKNRKKQG